MFIMYEVQGGGEGVNGDDVVAMMLSFVHID